MSVRTDMFVRSNAHNSVTRVVQSRDDILICGKSVLNGLWVRSERTSCLIELFVIWTWFYLRSTRFLPMVYLWRIPLTEGFDVLILDVFQWPSLYSSFLVRLETSQALLHLRIVPALSCTFSMYTLVVTVFWNNQTIRKFEPTQKSKQSISIFI